MRGTRRSPVDTLPIAALFLLRRLCDFAPIRLEAEPKPHYREALAAAPFV
jgi:hypothetical protein